MRPPFAPLLPLPDAWADLKASFLIPPPGSRLRRAGARSWALPGFQIPPLRRQPAARLAAAAGAEGAPSLCGCLYGRLSARRPPRPPARSGEAVAQPALRRAPPGGDPPRSTAECVPSGTAALARSEGTLHGTWGRSARSSKRVWSWGTEGRSGLKPLARRGDRPDPQEIWSHGRGQ